MTGNDGISGAGRAGGAGGAGGGGEAGGAGSVSCKTRSAKIVVGLEGRPKLEGLEGGEVLRGESETSWGAAG